jgi:hypothetical protein
MHRLFSLAVAALALLLSVPAAFADPVVSVPEAASTGGLNFDFLSVQAGGALAGGRGATDGGLGGVKWAGEVSQFAPGSSLQAALAGQGVKEVLVLKSSFALSQVVGSLSPQALQGALTFSGPGRLPFQQLLLLPDGAQVVAAMQGRYSRSVPKLNNPEPASLVLFGTGLAALGYRLKRRRREGR